MIPANAPPLGLRTVITRRTQPPLTLIFAGSKGATAVVPGTLLV